MSTGRAEDQVQVKKSEKLYSSCNWLVLAECTTIIRQSCW